MSDQIPGEVEIAVVRSVLAFLDSLIALCRLCAPRAGVVLAAAVMRIREEYPDVRGEEPEA